MGFGVPKITWLMEETGRVDGLLRTAFTNTWKPRLWVPSSHMSHTGCLYGGGTKLV